MEVEMSFETTVPRSKVLREQLDLAEQKGREEGEATALEPLARAVLDVLDRRRIAVSDERRAAVLTCTDPAKLRGFLVRAATAEMSIERMETSSEYLREQWDRAEARGREEGEARARAVLASAVFEVLAARRVHLSDHQRTVVLACLDSRTTHRWLVRAATVERADDLFAI